MCGSALLLVLSAFVLCSYQAQTNGTIDDQFGDSVTGVVPVYSPTNDVWKGANCTGCAISANTSLAHNGTWTSATYNPELESISIAFPFTGTALYVYFITANGPGSGTVTALTECNFTMDGEIVGSYQRIPDNSTLLNYNVLVYSNTSLTNTTHQFLISTAGQNHLVFIMFDYAIYTFDSVSPSTSGSGTSATSTALPVSTSDNIKHASLIAAIVGGVLGGLAIGLAVAILTVCRRRRRFKNSESNYNVTVSPYAPPPRDIDSHYQLPRPLLSASSLDGTTQLSVSHITSEQTDSNHSSISPTNASEMSASGTFRSLYAGVVGGITTAQLNEKSEMRSSRQTEPRVQVDHDGSHSGPNSPSSLGLSLSYGSRSDASDVMHQVEMIRAQVEQLQAQQQLGWVQHLPDQPPPSYDG